MFWRKFFSMRNKVIGCFLSVSYNQKAPFFHIIHNQKKTLNCFDIVYFTYFTSSSWIIQGCLIILRIWIYLETLSTLATSIIRDFTRILIAIFIWLVDECLTLPFRKCFILLYARYRNLLFCFIWLIWNLSIKSQIFHN